MKTQKKKTDTKKLVLLSLFTALVAILSYLGGFIKIGGLASISLTLIPVVIGAALCGRAAGAWLGAVASAIFFLTPDAAFWLGLSAPGTIVTVMVKGTLSGFAAGVVYEAMKKFNEYAATFVAAIVCPVVNTGIFLVGCRLFFFDTVKEMAVGNGMPVVTYLLVGFVGLNFVFELIANIVVSPVIVRLINIRNK